MTSWALVLLVLTGFLLVNEIIYASRWRFRKSVIISVLIKIRVAKLMCFRRESSSEPFFGGLQWYRARAAVLFKMFFLQVYVIILLSSSVRSKSGRKKKKRGCSWGNKFLGWRSRQCRGPYPQKNGATDVAPLFWIAGVNSSFQSIAFAKITNIWSSRECQYQSIKRTAVVFECVQ